MEKTIFGKIINREIPSKIVYEDPHCIAFEDIAPQAPTHILIVPKTRITQMSVVTKRDQPILGHLMWVANEVAKQLKVEQDYRLVVNNGPKSCQSVYHLHIHLLSGRQFGWPPG